MSSLSMPRLESLSNPSSIPLSKNTATVEKEVPASSSSAATPADMGSGDGEHGPDDVSSPPPATNNCDKFEHKH